MAKMFVFVRMCVCVCTCVVASMFPMLSVCLTALVLTAVKNTHRNDMKTNMVLSGKPKEKTTLLTYIIYSVILCRYYLEFLQPRLIISLVHVVEVKRTQECSRLISGTDRPDFRNLHPDTSCISAFGSSTTIHQHQHSPGLSSALWGKCNGAHNRASLNV